MTLIVFGGTELLFLQGIAKKYGSTKGNPLGAKTLHLIQFAIAFSLPIFALLDIIVLFGGKDAF